MSEVTFETIVEEFSAMQKTLNEKGAAMVNAEFKRIFDKYPELSCVKWTQYTPWFNDGDECTFRINEFVVSNAQDPENVNAWEDYEGDEEFGIDGKPVWVDTVYGDTAKRYPEIDKLERFAQSDIGEAIFKDIFDNHVVVTATRDGIETEEYEHE